MAKVPRAGNVKTRLQPYLSAAQCETLAEAFLFDAIRKARNLCDRLFVAFAPASEKSYFDCFDYENLMLVAQTGADLGGKMSNAFEFAHRLDSDAGVVIIGTDSPTFPPEFIEQAFAFLETGAAETVLGASDDGGFYLVGARKIQPRFFENVEWSSPRAFEQTKRNIEQQKIKLKLIPAWYDVDSPEDLRRLRDEVSRDEAAARKTAPQTFRWLIEHADVFCLKR